MIQTVYRTETGKRVHNEDALYVPDASDKTPVLIVADGMGGHVAGKQASTMAVTGISNLLSRTSPSRDAGGDVHEAIERVNHIIYTKSQTEEGYRGMGTTITLAVLLENGKYVVANVGDSRLYHFDGHTLTQVTVDHSLIAVLVAQGEITKEEAAYHPQRNIITRALGTSAYEEIDMFYRVWEPGHMLLLCSDGLHGTLDDDVMALILNKETTLQSRCDELVDTALLCGSRDNVTAVLCYFEEGGGEE